jgi:hypothetical protein
VTKGAQGTIAGNQITRGKVVRRDPQIVIFTTRIDIFRQSAAVVEIAYNHKLESKEDPIEKEANSMRWCRLCWVGAASLHVDNPTIERLCCSGAPNMPELRFVA